MDGCSRLTDAHTVLRETTTSALHDAKWWSWWLAWCSGDGGGDRVVPHLQALRRAAYSVHDKLNLVPRARRCLLENMEESKPGAGFKCCSMCVRHCFETHGDFGRSEAEELFSAPTFFQLIKAAHISGSKFLRIPVLFLERWNYNIGGTLSLKGPYGFKCEVTVGRHDQGFVLRTGFDAFMEHHMIEVGDSLVFYLVAESSLLVKVYDRCGSEKILQTKKTNEEDVEDSEGSDVVGSGEKGVDRMLRSRQKKLSETTPKEEVEVRSRGEAKQHLLSPLTRKQRSAQKRKLSETPDAYRGEPSGNEPDKPESKEVVKRQVKAANDLMEKLSSPSQLVVMTTTHVVHHQVFLGKLPLPNASTYLTLLDERGEQYTVRWSASVKPSKSRLSTGWNQVVVDHKLEIDDICIIEAMDPLTIKMYIFPFAKFYNPSSENQQQEQDVEHFTEVSTPAPSLS